MEESIWGYPYRLGIGIFIVVVTVLLTLGFVGLTVWLENSFKKERIQK
jgi:hypothetical protein